MKIGFVIDDTLDSNDGVQQYVLNLGKWMQSKGNEVHYLTGHTKRSDIDNVHSLSEKLPVKFNKNRLSIPLPSSPKKIAKILNNNDFDVLHVQMPYSPLLATRIIELAPATTAVVGTFHIAPFSKFHQRAARVLGYWLKPSLHRFDYIISVSESAQKMAKSSFKIDSHVIPNVVDFKKATHQKPKADQQNIVFLGRLVDRKNPITLIRAFSLFIKNYPKFSGKLIVAGSGPLSSNLMKTVKRMSIEDRVRFLGKVTEQKKYELLSTAKIAVFPSLGGESFGIVLIEAMAAGAGVVLGGDNPGYRSVLKNDDYLFQPDSDVELSLLIGKYLDNQLLKKAHSDQQKIVVEYSLNIVGPKIESAYQRAIENNKHKHHNKH